MHDDWPQNEDLLALVKESQEHTRAWALVRGVSKSLLSERKARPSNTKGGKPVGDKPVDWADKVNDYERRIIGQREQLGRLEECRSWEAGTEQILIDALREIAATDRIVSIDWAIFAAKEAVRKYDQRRGPRPA